MYRDILKNPLTADEICSLANSAGMSVLSLVNSRSQSFKDLRIDEASLTESEAADLMSRHPKTMKRPLLADGKRLVVGFDRQAMEKLLAKDAS